MVERRPKDNGVIINVYTESRIPRPDRIKKISSVRLPSQPRFFYDRRAQLLALAQELRHADPEQFKNPRRKTKKKRRWIWRWRWGVAAERIKRLFSRLHGTKRQWKYESIGREDCDDGAGKWSYCRRRGRKSHFCKKLMCLFKKISGVWRCKNRGY